MLLKDFNEVKDITEIIRHMNKIKAVNHSSKTPYFQSVNEMASQYTFINLFFF